MHIELDRVDRITAGAVGPAGDRTFFIQARQGVRLVSVLVEKQQVQLLAASVLEILSRTGKETGEGPPDEELELEEPVMPEWRAGRLAIGYEEEHDLLVLEAEELVPEVEEGEEEAEEGEEEGERAPADAQAAEEEHEPGTIRLRATREQMLSFARHGTEVCAAGRPTCRFCGNPIDPEGHACPALNGHRSSGE